MSKRNFQNVCWYNSKVVCVLQSMQGALLYNEEKKTQYIICGIVLITVTFPKDLAQEFCWTTCKNLCDAILTYRLIIAIPLVVLPECGHLSLSHTEQQHLEIHLCALFLVTHESEFNLLKTWQVTLFPNNNKNLLDPHTAATVIFHNCCWLQFKS